MLLRTADLWTENDISYGGKIVEWKYCSILDIFCCELTDSISVWINIYRLTYLLYLSTRVAELSIYLRNKETQQTLWVTVVRMLMQVCGETGLTT